MPDRVYGNYVYGNYRRPAAADQLSQFPFGKLDLGFARGGQQKHAASAGTDQGYTRSPEVEERDNERSFNGSP
jgi:hypothetical protein